MRRLNRLRFIKLTWRFGKENRKWYQFLLLLLPIAAGVFLSMAIPELQNREDWNILFLLYGAILLLTGVQIRWNRTLGTIFKGIVCIGIPMVAFYLTEFCFGTDLFALKANIIILNYGSYAAIMILFFAILGTAKGAGIATLLFSCLFAVANAFVMKFRGTPIVPWDVYSLRTAMSVSGNYTYSISKEMIVTIFITMLVILLVFQLPKSKINWVRYGIVLIAVGGGVFYGYHSIVKGGKLEEWGVERSLWSQAGAIKENGVWLNFVNNTKDFQVSKPKGYSYKEEEQKFSQYEKPVLSQSQKEKRPTIITIMNESFCDMAALVDEDAMELNQNPLPFLSEWTENVVKGHMLVSVYGGGTATSEFEFLTGQAQAFYPLDSVAYQQFIHKDTDSIASVLKSYGYKTIALHPFYGGGWNRFNVYPQLGLDRFISISNIKHYEQLNDYCSDASNYENIIEEYENRGEDPLFIFNVTMQNHGGYVENKIEHTIKENKVKDNSLDEYLSLAYESDRALNDLVNYFSEQEDPVVICFFGDHWPKLGKVVYNQLFDGVSEFDRAVTQHTVPFYIWANYDIEENEIEWTSPNFLSGLVMEIANLPLDPWRQYLKEVQEEIQAVSTIGYIDKKGELHQLDEENESVQKLSQAQYYYFQEREEKQ